MSEYAVPPVERAFKVLRYVGSGQSCANISRASKELQINRTTLLRLLSTLTSEGMLQSVGEGAGYRLGTGLITLAGQALFSRDIVQVAQPALRDVARQLGLSAHLAIMEGADIVYLLRETPDLSLVSNVRVGSHLPAHATTIGRIILAQLHEDELRAHIATWQLDAVTEKTSTTPDALIAQVKADRDLGIAWSTGNYEPGIGSAAVAVFDRSGSAVGAINVTGPEADFRVESGRRPEIETALKAVAASISQQLGHFPRGKLATGTN